MSKDIMKKKSFILYTDTLSIEEKLNDEQLGKLFRAIIKFQKGEEVSLPFELELVFDLFKGQFQRDKQKYEEMIEKRKQAGKAGGLAKASNASKCQQEVANLPDNDTVSVTGTDTLSTISKDIVEAEPRYVPFEEDEKPLEKTKTPKKKGTSFDFLNDEEETPPPKKTPPKKKVPKKPASYLGETGVVYGNKDINDMLALLKEKCSVEDFKESKAQQRIFGKHLCNLSKNIGEEEFKRRIKKINEDDFKSPNCNSIRFIFKEAKAFKGTGYKKKNTTTQEEPEVEITEAEQEKRRETVRKMREQLANKKTM